MDEVPDEQAYGQVPPEVHGHEEGDDRRVAAPAAPRAPALDHEPTGVASVDRVLAAVTAVADAPIGEHVQVFERAHEQLRRALDAQPDPTGDDRDA
jgi:hypothetical protein